MAQIYLAESLVSPGYTYMSYSVKVLRIFLNFWQCTLHFGGLGGLVHSTKSEIRSQAIEYSMVT